MEPEDRIVNFRDVGASLRRLGWSGLAPGRLYRGGRLHRIERHEQLLEIPTILNLRPQKNARSFEATWLRAPAPNSLEVYDTTSKATRAWLNKAVGALVGAEAPVYVHCTSGKDRTGVVVAATLCVLGVPGDVICEEYLLSQGDVDVRLMRRAIEGMGDVARYLRKVDVEALREVFWSP